MDVQIRLEHLREGNLSVLDPCRLDGEMERKVNLI